MNKRKRELLGQIEGLVKEHEKILKAAEEEKRSLTPEDGERLAAAGVRHRSMVAKPHR